MGREGTTSTTESSERLGGSGCVPRALGRYLIVETSMGPTAMIVGVVIALVAVIGVRPRGGRPVGKTQLMTVARVVVGLVVLSFALRH